MDEKPKSIWKKTLKGPNGLWLLLIPFTFVFAAIYTGGDVPDSLKNYLGLPAYALFLSVFATLMLLLAAKFFRWLCCWRNFKRFLFGLACFITFLALLVTEENWRGRQAWNQYRREGGAQGMKFVVAEIAPPSVPDEQNFALTPLLKPALDFVRTTNGIQWRDTNAYAHLQLVRADLNQGQTNEFHPSDLGNLEQGTLANLEAVRNFYRGNTNYPQPAKSGTAAEDILVALGKFDGELKELREAAATRPYSRFPIEYDYEPAAAILLPHLAQVKGIAEVVNVRALALLDAGQTERAFEELKLGFRLSDSIKDEPLLIDHLVRIAILTMDLQIVREGLARHAWSEAQLVEIEKILEPLNLPAELKQAIGGEHALEVDWVDYARRNGQIDLDSTMNDGKLMKKSISVLFGGAFYQNMLVISKLHQQYTMPSIDEKERRIFPDIIEASNKKIAEINSHKWVHPYWFYAIWLFPSFSKAEAKSGRAQTFVDEARVACALERHRLANGNFPESLAGLTPQFIESIPHDVIDGQPLRYHRMADGYILYGVGWNKIDEGGLIILANDKQKSSDVKKGDWVWRYPAR
jgi:tetratricopeptide (TPR) repeat protein